jgi:hypothetical protein
MVSHKANIRIVLDRIKLIAVHADLAHGPSKHSSAVQGWVKSLIGMRPGKSLFQPGLRRIAIGSFP